MKRVRLATGVAALLAAAAALGFATASSAGSQRTAAAGLCKSAGIRYLGTTSRGKKLCFTLWSSGKRISEYAYAYSDNCGSGTSRTTAKNGIPISPSGSFSTTGVGGGFFKGKITGSTAAGTLRAKSTNYGSIPPVTCDSGVLTWKARRAAG